MTPFATAALLGFAATLVLALGTWIASLVQRDVSLVDRMWSLLIAVPAIAYAWVLAPAGDLRFRVMAAILVVWAVRLALYVAWRNWGHGEDKRYTVIRERNEPNFAFKSIYLIFVLQAVLAWLVSLPLLAAAANPVAWSPLDAIGAAVAAIGFVFEAVGDQQLASFKADPANKGQVMDRGVWRWSRHPNYFGEFCVWWGFFVMALAAGGWWSVVSPLIMTGLLLKVSGVALLEKDIGERRPAYRDYIARTNAFFPRSAPPRDDGVTARAGRARGLPRSTVVAAGGSVNVYLVRTALAAAVLCGPLLLSACSTMSTKDLPPLELAPEVDIPRFMGDWYVIANIPTFIEKGAHSAKESYALQADGTIATTFTFRADAFDGTPKDYHSKGFVLGEHGAVWGQQYLWPFKADYRVSYVAPDYSQTVITREKRDYVWIMARTPTISEADLQKLTDVVARQGYDVSKLQRVPQKGG